MGLDIRFFGDATEAAELDGRRLTNIPGFLNFVLVLGEFRKGWPVKPNCRALPLPKLSQSRTRSSRKTCRTGGNKSAGLRPSQWRSWRRAS
jgi:hypothetical protein